MEAAFKEYKVVKSVEDWVREVIDRNDVDVISEEFLFESKLFLEALPMIGADKMSRFLEELKERWNKRIKGLNSLVLNVDYNLIINDKEIVAVEVTVKFKLNGKVVIDVHMYGGSR